MLLILVCRRRIGGQRVRLHYITRHTSFTHHVTLQLSNTIAPLRLRMMKYVKQRMSDHRENRFHSLCGAPPMLYQSHTTDRRSPYLCCGREAVGNNFSCQRGWGYELPSTGYVPSVYLRKEEPWRTRFVFNTATRHGPLVLSRQTRQDQSLSGPHR